MSDMEQMYQQYAQTVYRFLLSKVRNADLAEELTQETFYQAIRHLKSYKGTSTVYAWLCGIAKNLWKSELRRRKSHPSAAEIPDEPDPAPPPDESAESREISVTLLRKLHGLPEQDKELILLRAAAGLSFRTIGEIFGKTENWARVSFYRAKQKLKEDEDI